MRIRSTFRRGRRHVRRVRQTRDIHFVYEQPSPGQEDALRPGERLVGGEGVPRFVEAVSFPSADPETGDKFIPLRLRSKNRGPVAYPNYRRDIVENKEPYIIMQSAWVLTIATFWYVVIPLVLLGLAIWLSTVHLTGFTYGPGAYATYVKLGNTIPILDYILFGLSVLGFALIYPLRKIRYLRWWTRYWVVIEAAVLVFAGWLIPDEDSFQQQNIKGVKAEYWGIGPFKLLGRYVFNLGHVTIYGNNGKDGRITNIHDPFALEKFLTQVLVGEEKDIRRTAENTELLLERAAEQLELARLGNLWQQYKARLTEALGVKGGPLTPDEVAAIKAEFPDLFPPVEPPHTGNTDPDLSPTI